MVLSKKLGIYATDHHTRLHALALPPPHTSSMLVITTTSSTLVITAIINKDKLNTLTEQLARALVQAAQEYQPYHQLCVEAANEIATEMVGKAGNHLVELELDDPSDHFTLEFHFDMDVLARMALQLKDIRVKKLQDEQNRLKLLDSRDLN